MKIETYPPNINSNYDFPYYYLEFIKLNDIAHETKETWTLYKRNFIMSMEDWDALTKNDKNYPLPMSPREGHPYNLANGTVNEFKDVIRMHTKKFLQFMVDALNHRTYDLEYKGI
jgi:hypothetical protein